jgi:hypothetical protein
MKDRSSTVAATGVIYDNEWSQLVSSEDAADRNRPAEGPPALHGAIVGALVGLVDGVLLVTYPGQVSRDPVPCRTVVNVDRASVGRQVLLVFEDGDPRRPVLVGCLTSGPSASAAAVDVKADGATVTVTARERIVLRCGKASITLTSAGKVILQGEYISQRSMGVVRIKGGCVEIN